MGGYALPEAGLFCLLFHYSTLRVRRSAEVA